MRFLPRLLLAVSLLALGACRVFDPTLYQTDAAAGPELRGELADICGATAPLLFFPSGAQTLTVPLDTRGGTNDTGDVGGCLDEPQNGPDLFLAIDGVPSSERNEWWHFHIRVTGGVGDGDPAIYVLSNCDERACSDGDGLDVCEADSDEHFTFLPSAEQQYIVAFDSPTEGFEGRVEAYRTVCGDGVAQHSEGCDDGNDVNDDLCDNMCRTNVTADNPDEDEVNDDPYSANHLILAGDGTIGVIGGFDSACEVDFFSLDVPAGGADLTVTLLEGDGDPCAAAYDGTELELWGESREGTPQREVIGTVADGEVCPTLSEAGLSEGTYWVRVVNVQVDPRTASLEYRLDLALTTSE